MELFYIVVSNGFKAAGITTAINDLRLTFNNCCDSLNDPFVG
jgi:hypothetical protein